MKLYNFWRSTCSWRVRIALHHKGLAFEYLPVHLVKDGGEQNQDSYREKNPMRTVPMLELDSGQRISQSLAILEYLEEAYPQKPLLPRDLMKRASVRQLSEMVNSGIQPLQNLSVIQYVKGELQADERAFAKHWITRGMTAFEATLGTTAGKYCHGDELSFADVCLIPQLHGARRFGVDVALFPTCLRIEKACEELPAFLAAHADSQVDAQQA